MILTVCCVAGLIFAAMVRYSRLLHPIPGAHSCLVIPGRGEGRTLEQSVRAAVWLRKLGLLNSTLLIADVDLTPEGEKLARQLTLRWDSVVLCPATEVNRYIQIHK